MKIKSIKIKGWRSFNDEDGIELRDLKKFNLIIGPNNSGKSNVLRFFHTLKELCSYRLQSSHDPAGLLTCDCNTHLTREMHHIKAEDFWSYSDAKFSGTILFEDLPPTSFLYRAERFGKLQVFEGFVQIKIACKKKTHATIYNDNGWEISLNPAIPMRFHELLYHMPGSDDGQLRAPVTADGQLNPTYNVEGIEYKKQVALILAKKPSFDSWLPIFQRHNGDTMILTPPDINQGNSLKYEKMTGNETKEYCNLAKPIVGTFLESIYCISPVRDHSRSDSKTNYGVDGSDIVKTCKELKDSKAGTNIWGDFKDKIEHWMCAILGEPTMEIDFDAEDLRFRVQRGGGKKYQYFHQLGTGVSQLFMLFAYLLLNKGRTLHVFLDEPENSLHPQATAQLVRTLMEPEFQMHRFFICSHASSLMDMVDQNWSVHRVSFSNQKGTIVEPCTDIVSKCRLLDDMGIRASQMLQSNFVIWVEGPSDRVYIRSWIRAWSGNTLFEGRHFSFAFYGGSVLRYYGFVDPTEEDVEECISLFSTSRYSMVVMDSDKKSDIDNDRPIIAKLQAALEASPDKKRYISIWQTAGREIENYVPASLWDTMLADNHVWRSRIKVNATPVKLETKQPAESKELPQFENFADYLCRYYVANGSPVLANAQPELPRHHDGQKVRIAGLIAEKWTSPIEMHDLDTRMKDLISRIKVANG